MERVMIYLYGGIIVCYLVLLTVTVGERIAGEKGKPEKFFSFQKAAAWLLRKERQTKGRDPVRKRKSESGARLLGQKMRALEPGGHTQSQVAAFQINRCAAMLRIGFGGTLMCMVIWVLGQTRQTIDGGSIPRNAYGQGEIEVTLKAKVEGEESEEVIPYVVEERSYTQKELDALYQEALQCLAGEMKGENTDLENVRTDLNLPSSLEGYPFRITWESESYERVNVDGSVQNEELQEDEVVMLTAGFRYQEWARDHQIYVRVRPALYTEQELLHRKLEELLRAQDEKSRTSVRMDLPANMDQRAIVWGEMQEDSSAPFLLLVILVAGIVYWSKEKELDQRLEKRRLELQLDYPEIVNKLTLYMGAGMTIRNAFLKLGEDYKKKGTGKRRYLYEEILQTCYELQSGKSEAEAYDSFGRRCQLQSYIRLSTLLVQNIRKGSNDLMEVLRREVVDAFADRKKTARKLGEEAGTKLLIPMMLMLCIVMVIIMIPAYFSFAM